MEGRFAGSHSGNHRNWTKISNCTLRLVLLGGSINGTKVDR